MLHNAGAEQIEARTAVHVALDGLQAVDLTLDVHPAVSIKLARKLPEPTGHASDGRGVPVLRDAAGTAISQMRNTEERKRSKEG